MTQKSIDPLKIAIVILARNESSVIQKTVENVCEALRPTDALFVVADNCNDDTAQIARNAGARAIVRGVVKPQGKGAALAWFMNYYQVQILEYDYMVVLDADSLIPKDFIQKLADQLVPGTSVAQCYLSPINYEGSPLTTLLALSDIIEQTVFDRIRAGFGFSVRLRGTGMIFTPRLLLSLCPGIGTEVEDIALSLMIAKRRIVVKWFRSLIVYDPKPMERSAATRQRARWFRGQWVAFWNYRAIIFDLFARGPAGWSVLGSLFLKPRWLKLALCIALGIVCFWQPAISTLAFLLSGLEILLFLMGIILLPNRRPFVKSLLFVPSFILMWVKSIFLSQAPSMVASERVPGYQGV